MCTTSWLMMLERFFMPQNLVFYVQRGLVNSPSATSNSTWIIQGHQRPMFLAHFEPLGKLKILVLEWHDFQQEKRFPIRSNLWWLKIGQGLVLGSRSYAQTFTLQSLYAKRKQFQLLFFKWILKIWNPLCNKDRFTYTSSNYR